LKKLNVPLESLELHTRANLAYKQALDLATLSSVMWMKFIKGGRKSTDQKNQTFEHLEQAIALFDRCQAFPELSQCSQQCNDMQTVLAEFE